MHPTLFLISKRLIALTLICATIFTFISTSFVQTVYAEDYDTLIYKDSSNTSQTTLELDKSSNIEDAQARQTIFPDMLVETDAITDGINNVAQDGLACSGAILLRNVLTSTISNAISGVVQGALGAVKGIPVNTTFDTSNQHQLGEVRARSGTYTLGGTYIGVGWDSIAWCIVNAMIEHITNSTIAWANSGFNGNPAFIENPGRFFSDLADYQAGKIISDIAYGSSRGRVNICQPFRLTVAIGLAQSYRNDSPSALDQLYDGMSCRLSDITQNNFFGGIRTQIGPSSGGLAGNTVNRASATGFVSWTDWILVTQQDANNPYGAYILANQALYSAVQARESEIRFEVGLNDGWLNFKKCSDPKDPQTCNTTTPGRLIESSLNQTLGLSKQRLIMANKFDEMITAIVNNLIRVSLNKVLQPNE